jgi:glycosyltransferase involved in cell wall biosynthesis
MNKPLKIALYHGYELGGSGSNEYTRYLAHTLAKIGHQVMVICRDFEPEAYDFVSRAVAYDVEGKPTVLFEREVAITKAGDAEAGSVSLHQLPETSIYPVFIKDKQRSGTVKSFPEMTAEELAEYRNAMVAAVTRALQDEKPDILHANHLVYQPVVAKIACEKTGVPFYIVPHGSSIEYTVKEDERFLAAAREGLEAAKGLFWIAREVRDRVYKLFEDIQPQLAAKSKMVGVGTDTSLFEPVAPADRRASLSKLASMHRKGGKTPAMREQLEARLDKGELDACRGYWDAYDHKVEDSDLPERLSSLVVDDDLLFFVGAMTYGKGVQSLIAALPEVLSRRPRTRLVIVGSGTYREVLEALVHAISSGNEALFEQIVAKGQDLERQAMSGPLEDLAAHVADAGRKQAMFENGANMAKRVHFLGRLDHPRLRCIFPCCRIGVFPSVIKEASPLVFAEALANGVLPTGSYHSGLRDGLDDLKPHVPEASWRAMCLPVQPDGRVAGIASQLCELLDALEKEDLSSELRRIAVDHYDWTAICQKLATAASEMIR